jgi:hypothetical protein
MRVMSEAPRGLAAKRRSSAITGGRSLAIACSASSGSESANVRISSSLPPTRSRNAGINSGAAIRIIRGAGIAAQSKRVRDDFHNLASRAVTFS